MTNNLAQRAADELEAELKASYKAVFARDAIPTRRSEPMPEPVPEWLKRKVCEEAGEMTSPNAFSWAECTFNHLAARLIWERGDAEPVDPLLIEAREIVINDGTDRTEHQKAVIRTHDGTNGKVALALAALKRGMELAKEIG